MLYPRSDTIESSDISYAANDNNDKVTVEIVFIDLMNTEDEISEIIKGASRCHRPLEPRSLPALGDGTQ
jgi:hypothetical protein